MVQPASKRLVTEDKLDPLKNQVTTETVAAALPERLGVAALDGTYQGKVATPSNVAKLRLTVQPIWKEATP